MKNHETGSVWAYRSFKHYEVRVHRGECAKCNFGCGHARARADKKYGVWQPFESLAAAFRFAEQIRVREVAVCKVCLGAYRGR